MPSRKSKYTKELLAPIVASSSSKTEVLSKLGLPSTGGNHRMITAHIRHAELDTSHFGYGSLKERIIAASELELVALVARSTSFAQVLSALGLPTAGRSHHLLSERVKVLGIDTLHFRGHGWSRGETRASHPSVEQLVTRRMRSDEDVFRANSTYADGPAMVRRLVAKGWEYRCAICGITDWRGEPLVLHLDHANGIHNDNRVENLRLLCPNCHSQTPTYCNRAREASTLSWILGGVCVCYTTGLASVA